MRVLVLLFFLLAILPMADTAGLEDLPLRADALAVLLVYIVGLLSIGFVAMFIQRRRAAREGETGSGTQDHFLGSGFGLVVLFFTLFASTFSGWTLMGMPGDAYKQGVSGLGWVSSFAVVYLSSLTVVPRLYRLSKTPPESGRYVTAADFVFDRFDRSHPLNILTTLVMLFPTILYALLQFKAMGVAVSVFSAGAISKLAGAAMLGVVMVIYESAGGMRGVAWAQVFQGLLLMSCFLIFLILQEVEFGGFGEAFKLAAESQNPVLQAKTVVPDPGAQAGFMSLLVIMTCFPIYPHQVVRYFAADTSNKLRRGVALLAASAFFAFSSVCILGWVALRNHHVAYGNVTAMPLADSESDGVFAAVCRDLIDLGTGGYWLAVFLIAGATAAMMSTADAALMATSSLLTCNIVGLYVWPLKAGATQEERCRRDKKLLYFSKGSVAIIIAVLVLVANLGSLSLTGLAKLQQQFLMQLFPAFLLGLHMGTLKPSPVFAGMLSGVGLTTFIMLAQENMNAKLLKLHAGLWGVALNLAVLFAMHYYDVWYTNTNVQGGYTYYNPRIKMLDDAKRDEPVRHPWVFALGGFVALCSVPFYRPTGGQDGFVGSIPAWGMIIWLCAAGITVTTVFAAMRYWATEPGEAPPRAVAGLASPRVLDLERGKTPRTPLADLADKDLPEVVVAKDKARKKGTLADVEMRTRTPRGVDKEAAGVRSDAA